MSQMPSIKTKLKQSIQNDVNAQIKDLKFGLGKMKSFINDLEKVCHVKLIIDNKNFLKDYVRILIEELDNKLQQYANSFDEMSKRGDLNLIEILKSTEVNFLQFYEEYEFIHSQIYFFNERKIILQKEDPDRDFKLIYDILNPVDE